MGGATSLCLSIAPLPALRFPRPSLVDSAPAVPAGVVAHAATTKTAASLSTARARATCAMWTKTMVARSPMAGEARAATSGVPFFGAVEQWSQLGRRDCPLGGPH